MKRKNNKYAHLSEPQATLDFHDRGSLSPTEITNICEGFLVASKGKNYRFVLIITGKGMHSKSGPIVKPIIEEVLHTHKDVASFKEARRDRGGFGAFEVKLL